MVRGYHVYNDIWTAVVDEELDCRCERLNTTDRFAVAVVKGHTTVGHILRKISSVCLTFLRKNGSIRCRIAGPRRYSADLPQGGLEIPCVLCFRGCNEITQKAKKFIDIGLATTSTPTEKGERQKDNIN